MKRISMVLMLLCAAVTPGLSGCGGENTVVQPDPDAQKMSPQDQADYEREKEQSVKRDRGN